MEKRSLRWQQIYFNVLSVTIVVTIAVTLAIDRCSGCLDLVDWLGLIESSTGKGILYATAIISFMEVGRMVLLPADYLRLKLIKPLEDRIFNRGKAEMRAEIVDWMERKEEAEREGRPFDEPMPGAEYNGTSPVRNGS